MKQVYVLNQKLSMSTGKTISQACHGCMRILEEADQEKLESWKTQGAKKVIVKSSNLDKIAAEMENQNIQYTTVRDEGKTEVPKGSKTCLVTEPAPSEKLDVVTGDLELV